MVHSRSWGRVSTTLPSPPVDRAAGTSSLAPFMSSAAAEVSWPSWVERSTAGAAAAWLGDGVGAGGLVSTSGRAMVWSSGVTFGWVCSTGLAAGLTSMRVRCGRTRAAGWGARRGAGGAA